jgi:DNA-binding NarL/FixJ family response regulator
MRMEKRDGAVKQRATLAKADDAACLIREMLKHARVEGATGHHSSLDPGTVVLERNVDGFRYLLVRSASPTDEFVSLSPREQEIVRMVAKGHPNKIIADVLEISCWTVSTYLRRIFAKLGVGSRAAMVAKVLHRTPGDL